MTENKKEIPTYYRLDTYVDNMGKMVTEKLPINSTFENVEFIGRALVATPKGPMPVEFAFSDKCKTVSGCFANFNDECESAIQKMIEEEKSKIVMPFEGSDKIITPT